MNKIQALIAFSFLMVLPIFSETNPSPAFEAFKKDPSTAQLPDYSYAGYKFGTEEIPVAKGKIFDVSKYGAIPNDNLEDFDGVQAAIKAAEAAGGGIVFFPKGKFLINEQEGRRNGIVISKANIILKGSGSEADGTEIFMKYYMLPKDSTKKWTVPAMFSFDDSQSSNVKTQITKDAKRGAMKIEVADASKFKVGDFVKLKMQNKAANSEFMEGMTTWDNWTNTNEKGVLITELHKVSGVNGNELLFSEPLHTDITASFEWSVSVSPLTEGLGVEDIWFRGNFKEIVVHHKNFIHDAGWGFLSMARPANGYVRRIRLTDVCLGVHMTSAYACSMMNIRFDGNPGHAMLNAISSYGVLIGYVHDATNAPGMWHGPCCANSSSGTVMWRYLGQARSGPDFHASYPYCTLVDASTSKYIGNGGNAALLPNHMKDLTYWNLKQIGKFENVDFWEPQTRGDGLDMQNKEYGRFAKIVKPNIIGMYGDEISFVKEHLNLYESQGTPVTPESLYEAQLELRLGKLPNWISESKKAWEMYLTDGRLNF